MKPLLRRPLPHTDLEVSELCLGAGGFGTGVKGDAADRLVADFVAAGGNFFDTAHCYAFWIENGLGASERELGASLRRLGCLDQAVIGTKGGHPDGGPLYPRPPDFLAERVIAGDIEESLNRLGLERIPLYYLHRDDGKTPVEEILGTLNREIERGRVGHIAASNWSVKRLAAANAYAAERGIHGFVASQMQWSLAEPKQSPVSDRQSASDPTTRFVTAEDAAWHAAAGVPIVAYSATAGGYFAGRGHDRKSFAGPANQARYERAVALAERLGRTPTQIALAYLMRQEPVTIPLFSTASPAHLAEALGAAAVALDPEQVRWLREGAAHSQKETQ